MMSKAVSLGAFLLILLGSAAGAAAPEIDTDEKRVQKFAVPNADVFSAKPKGLCVCIDDPVTGIVRTMGILTFQRAVDSGTDVIRVLCQALRYSQSTGDRTSATICDDWVPLAK